MKFTAMIVLLAITAIAGAQNADYTDPTPMKQGDWNMFLDQYYNPDYANITALQGKVEKIVADISNIGNTDKDNLEINVENGSLALSHQSFDGKNVKINGNGAHIAIDGDGNTAADSIAPQAGAAANSQIGGDSAISEQDPQTSVSGNYNQAYEPETNMLANASIETETTDNQVVGIEHNVRANLIVGQGYQPSTEGNLVGYITTYQNGTQIYTVY